MDLNAIIIFLTYPLLLASFLNNINNHAMINFNIRRIISYRSVFNTRKIASSNYVKKSDIEIHLEHISNSLEDKRDKIVIDLKTYGFSIIDNFLGIDYCKKYRKEAETLYKKGILLLEL